MDRDGRNHRRTHVVMPRDINNGNVNSTPFSVLGGPSRGSRQADLWEAMMNVSGNRIRSLRYLSGK